ncbi:hypothetical protein J116_001170 [Streptomyces thermolilacinus SPC6]|uniref:Uncharacterized protein n=1 Tax=Streptomyces thermolilacinus SPC6 TaxID=1306406 RepID=A0A1D3DLU8_9ACTN|nr:hypothetical protein J116_001170 [Streptomyces thermolilacinus SPC6]
MLREFVIADGTRPEDAAQVCREALWVLRPALHTVYLDAYSDEPWPPEVAGAYDLAVALGEATAPDGFRGDHRMGIQIDVRDDIQFGVLLELAPHTIGAEGYRGDRQVFSAADTGTSLWFALTEEQHGRLLARLDEPGISAAVSAAPPRRRRRWWPSSWGFHPRP